MKKVKFTLGLMLAILFIGANVISAKDYEPEKADKSYANRGIRSSLFVNPSTSYANSIPSNIFGTTDESDAVRQGYVFQGATLINPSGGAPVTLKDTAVSYPFKKGVDIRKSSALYDTEFTGTGYWEFLFNNMDQLLYQNKKIKHFAEVDLLFEDGKEIIPFFERTIHLGMWMYDPEEERNVWVRSGIVVKDKLNEIWKKDKTMFTAKSGIATYRYETDYMELYRKYPIHSITYEIWTNDETNTPYDKNYGEGSAYPTTLRPLLIDADAGITTSIRELDLFESRKDVTFTVYAEPGKDLDISTNSQYWTIANGGLKVVSKGAGLWEVTLIKLNAKITVKISYVPEPESATGNGNVTEDKVWGAGGTLYIQSAGEGQLSVYSITGQLVKSAVISGDYSATLPKGLYIIKLNNKAYKAIL
jgi:hypothetical protein